MRRVRARSGLTLPVVGQGTWRMGEDPSAAAAEEAALRTGLELGLTLIDTAEMYGDGGAERLVGRVVADRRDQVQIVSKVLPQNASREGVVRACEASLRRLNCERLDLYLLHWPGPHPLEQTLEGFRELVEQGKILHYGVSNFDTAAMDRLESLPGGSRVAVNQVLYNLTRRGIENGLIPRCRKRGVAVMAYSPLEQGRLPPARLLDELAARHGCTRARLALAWTLREPGVVTIAKATGLDHVRDNATAAELELPDEEWTRLDAAFPRGGVDRLEVL